MKRFLPLIIVVCACLLPLFFPSCANTTQAPSGGKKDTIPPYIIDIKPLPRTVNVPVKGVTFEFVFNEYVTIKTPANIFLSPPQQRPPKSRLRGRSLLVSFEEPLEPNTTYTLSFTDAIADANEGNMFAGYTYVFSTGSQIDTMMMTGTVVDCNTLAPVKGATVLLHKDHGDSAIFNRRPYAAVKTDDWGFFALPFIQDTLYRLYAIRDADQDNRYNPETETVAFIDSLIRPVMVAGDTVREMLKYDMLDTLRCLARRSEHELKLFREKPSRQFIVNKVRTAERSAYLTFQAPGAWIDSLWIRGYQANQVITQFNIEQDSLEIWINSRRAAPDTMRIFVNYRKTDTLGRLMPTQDLVLRQHGVPLLRGNPQPRRHHRRHGPQAVPVGGETLQKALPLLSFREGQNPVLNGLQAPGCFLRRHASAVWSPGNAHAEAVVRQLHNFRDVDPAAGFHGHKPALIHLRHLPGHADGKKALRRQRVPVLVLLLHQDRHPFAHCRVLPHQRLVVRPPHPQLRPRQHQYIV